MNYVIGDIHGEITKLRQLVKNILAECKNPVLIFIGDYLDKGENPAQVLDYLIELSKSYNCTFLLGNHEYYWMKYTPSDTEIREYLLKYGGINTINALNCQSIDSAAEVLNSKYKSFFDSLVPYHIHEDFLMTHSGISEEYINHPLDMIPEKEFLFNRYPFIRLEKKYLNKYTTIFGHTGFFTVYFSGVNIGIDTAACYLEKQPLTAMNLDTKRFIDSDNNSFSLDSLRLDVCPNIIRTKVWRNS